MKPHIKENAIEVYYPDRKKPVKVAVKLSKSGAKKGMAIGAMIGSKVLHPLGVPVCSVLGGIAGAILGEED